MIGSTPFTAAIEHENRKARAVQREFNRRLRDLCIEHRIGWVDPERMRFGDVDALHLDALHLEAASHEKLAALVREAYGA